MLLHCESQAPIKEEGWSWKEYPTIKKILSFVITWIPNLWFMPPTPFGSQEEEEEEDKGLSIKNTNQLSIKNTNLVACWRTCRWCCGCKSIIAWIGRVIFRIIFRITNIMGSFLRVERSASIFFETWRKWHPLWRSACPPSVQAQNYNQKL